MIEPGFHLQLNKNPVNKETVELYAYSKITTYENLASFRLDIISSLYCPESFKGIFQENEHLCGEIEDDASTEKVTKYQKNKTKIIPVI